MSRHLNQTVALVAAVFITIVSLNAIVTVPPAEAAVVTAPILA